MVTARVLVHAPDCLVFRGPTVEPISRYYDHEYETMPMKNVDPAGDEQAWMMELAPI
jgi:hypothetical protein